MKPLVVAGAGLLMQTGAGCLTPTIVADDGDMIMLKYGAWDSLAEVQRKAEAMCAEDGRVAYLSADIVDDFEPVFRYATFDCIGDEPPST
jgi:hypothetical protein